MPLPVPELAAAVAVLPSSRRRSTAPAAPTSRPTAASVPDARAGQGRGARAGAGRPREGPRRAAPNRPRTAADAAPAARRGVPSTGPSTQLRTPLRQRSVVVDANARRAPQRRRRALGPVAPRAIAGSRRSWPSPPWGRSASWRRPPVRCRRPPSDQAGAALGPQAAAAVGVVALARPAQHRAVLGRARRRPRRLGVPHGGGLAVAGARSHRRLQRPASRDSTTPTASCRRPSCARCRSPRGHKLRADAAVRLIRLNEVYKGRFGSDLCLTDSYRSLASQYSLAARKPGLAARPGTSEHGWGLAIDVCGGPDQVGSARRDVVPRERSGVRLGQPGLGASGRQQARAVALGVRRGRVRPPSRPAARDW